MGTFLMSADLVVDPIPDHLSWQEVKDFLAEGIHAFMCEMDQFYQALRRAWIDRVKSSVREKTKACTAKSPGHERPQKMVEQPVVRVPALSVPVSSAQPKVVVFMHGHQPYQQPMGVNIGRKRRRH